ncbi:MAG: aspartate aminotransferase family protein [Gammaproteobacteria bacterium]|jgi:acetylornithine/N-succinyldiaminopimelate aminotransferase|nr:aspartate aminotransferase family protein [Gammaproteobacteria bacterium]
MSTYSRLPVTFERGEGAWLWDTRGNKYLDALSGIAVCGLGHAHPAVSAALCAQAKRLIHTSNLYGVALQEQLADELTGVAGMDRVFFCNSGAESVEAAIKLARLYGHQRHIAQPAIIVAEKSFHGRTLATLSATGNRKVQAGFEPLVQGFVRVPYNDVEALHAVARNSPQVVAVLVEPIQGEGGIIVPDDHYLKQVRELCDRHGWLMMLDEIQTGMGRTGRWFAYQHHDLYPDVIAVAKGLANGVPIGACLARGAAAGVYQPGNHGSTFGGNPLACSAALAVLATIKAGKLTERAAVLGQRMLAGLKAALAGCGLVAEIRGRGLMIGIELTRPSAHLPAIGLERGILFSIQSEKVIRLLPPLIISDAEADEIVTRIGALVREEAARAA